LHPNENRTRLLPQAQLLLDKLIAHCLSPVRLDEPSTYFLANLAPIFFDANIALGGSSLVLQTPHPQLDMLVHRWRHASLEEVAVGGLDTIVDQFSQTSAEGKTETYHLRHGHVGQAMYTRSPIAAAHRVASLCLWRIEEHIDPPLFPIFEDLHQRGETEYLVAPVPMPSPYRLALSFSTRAQHGFPAQFAQVMEQALPYFRLVLAHKIERVRLTELLGAYIGRGPAKQVAAGKIRHGDFEHREVVLGLVDLHNFTELTERLGGLELMALMHWFYDSIDLAVTEHGGEILSFVGDAALIVFTYKGLPRDACAGALAAMEKLECAVKTKSNESAEMNISYSSALHHGNVLYGNIGAPGRLDFTVVGETVRLTSRLQKLASRKKLALLLSQDFVAHLESLPLLVGSYPVGDDGRSQTVYRMKSPVRAG
jgi:adenylate cyclase